MFIERTVKPDVASVGVSTAHGLLASQSLVEGA
jgi:hypothetical protein